jgi:shikimate kinase
MKSTIAKTLSKHTGIPFVDLDQYIEKTNLTINTILNSEGNLLKLEHQAFVEYEFLQSK